MSHDDRLPSCQQRSFWWVLSLPNKSQPLFRGKGLLRLPPFYAQCLLISSSDFWDDHYHWTSSMWGYLRHTPSASFNILFSMKLVKNRACIQGPVWTSKTCPIAFIHVYSRNQNGWRILILPIRKGSGISSTLLPALSIPTLSQVSCMSCFPMPGLFQQWPIPKQKLSSGPVW